MQTISLFFPLFYFTLCMLLFFTNKHTSYNTQQIQSSIILLTGTIWSGPSLEEQNQIRKLDPAYTIRPNSGCMLAVMAITGCNQNASRSDPACSLGYQSSGYLFFTQRFSAKRAQIQSVQPCQVLAKHIWSRRSQCAKIIRPGFGRIQTAHCQFPTSKLHCVLPQMAQIIVQNQLPNLSGENRFCARLCVCMCMHNVC